MGSVLAEHHRRRTIVNGRATFLGWSNDSLRACSFGESLNLLADVDKAMAFNDVFISLGGLAHALVDQGCRVMLFDLAFAAVYPVLKKCE
jgi:hypothetical protein